MFIGTTLKIHSANNAINAPVVCQEISNVVESRSMATTKRRLLTSDEQEDVDRLREIVEKKKKDIGLTQARLAELCGWESQGTVAQYLGKHVALNLDAAFRFSKALEVPLDSFSPRLAARAVEIFGATIAAKEPPLTIDALLLTFQDDINKADNDVHMAIADLVKAYKDDPSEGTRIARSIRALLGQL